MKHGFFVTGTDTGVGKTLVSCMMAAGLGAAGFTVGVMKPIETGCTPEPGGLHPSDAALLQLCARNTGQQLEDTCPFRFAEALAPSVAARRAGVEVNTARIVEGFHRIAAYVDVMLVEGAGGLLVPVSLGVTMADLAQRLGLSLVVVVASKLGALNHALLTMESARSRGLRVLGYVMNFPYREAGVAAETNVEELREWLGPPLAVVPHSMDLAGRVADQEYLVSAFESFFDVQRLLSQCGLGPA